MLTAQRPLRASLHKIFQSKIMTLQQNTWYRVAISNIFPCEGKLSITVGDSVFIIYAKSGYENSSLGVISGVFESDTEIKLRIQKYENFLSVEIYCSKSKDFSIISLTGGEWSVVSPVFSYAENIICELDNFNIINKGSETLDTVTGRGNSTNNVIVVGGVRIQTGGYLSIPQSLPAEIPEGLVILYASETGFAGTNPSLNYAPIVGGKIPSQYLPSYVDDIIDGFLVSSTQFSVGGSIVSPESGKLYVDITNEFAPVIYRWSGSVYVNAGSGNGSLALGETDTTAYRGDRGKVAYEHSLKSGNPHGLSRQDIDAAYKNGNTNEQFSMSENINQRLRIPKINSLSAPSGLTEGEFYLYAMDM